MWFIVIVLAYFFFSLSSLGDKLILNGTPKANSYTFYTSVASLFVLLILPFVGLALPPATVFIWIIADALVYILGLYTMYCVLEKSDVSSVITTIGAIQPIFIFILTCLFWGGQIITGKNFLAFALLLLGSYIISFKKNKKVQNKYLAITILSSLLFSLDYAFLKVIYSNLPFLQGFIWTRIFLAFFALLMLFNKNNRKEIFRKENLSNKKIELIFVYTYLSSGAANILQNFAIFLVPIGLLPIINAMRGVQYVFLFVLTLLFSIFLPKVFKERVSKTIIIQKVSSIIIIAIGLALLFF